VAPDSPPTPAFTAPPTQVNAIFRRYFKKEFEANDPLDMAGPIQSTAEERRSKVLYCADMVLPF
jgi:hypothetical protein